MTTQIIKFSDVVNINILVDTSAFWQLTSFHEHRENNISLCILKKDPDDFSWICREFEMWFKTSINTIRTGLTKIFADGIPYSIFTQTSPCLMMIVDNVASRTEYVDIQFVIKPSIKKKILEASWAERDDIFKNIMSTLSKALENNDNFLEKLNDTYDEWFLGGKIFDQYLEKAIFEILER